MASFRCPAAVRHADHFRAQKPHAEDVQPLPPHVFLAHIDDAFQAEQRADGGSGDAVLSRAGFGDDALLAHAPRQKRLAQAVVDLVRAGVQQVLTLDVNLGAAMYFAEAFRKVQRCRAAGVVGQQILQLRLKGRVPTGFQISLLEFFERRHQNFGDKASAVRTKMAAGIWQLQECLNC